MRTDLHIHTNASDGTWTPKQLVEQVKAKGIELFAVADHETIANVEETDKLATAEGLKFVRAVELSSSMDALLCHVLSYNVDITNQGLLDYIDNNQKLMHKASVDGLKSLKDRGFKIDLDAYNSYSYDRSRGGWTMLNFLIDTNIATSGDDFFHRLFAGRIHEAFPKWPSLKKAVEVVKNAGGTPILAHPGDSTKAVAKEELDKTLDSLVACGIEGFECYSTYHTVDSNGTFADYCRKNSLFMTGGSDCHGTFIESRKLGQPEVYSKDLSLGFLSL